MLYFKDAFISYSRRNLAFARKLHDALSSHSLDVWFDQNDIPLAVDFQFQIDEGIRKADNFIYIISPDAIKSPYCEKEIKMAVACGKRIIPILYEMPSNSEVNDYMHPVIQKLNWVYMNNEDLFDNKILDLLSIINHCKDYVQQHTILLNKALDWEERRKNTKYLLVDKARTEAEQWLLQEFETTQAPCSPSDLVCQYICDSRENAENLLHDVFIAATKEDAEAVNKINNALQRYCCTTWTYATDFHIGTNYEVAVREGIEKSDNFLLVISNNLSLQDDCLKQLEYAAKLNKRIVPVLVEDVPRYQLHPTVKDLLITSLTTILDDKEAVADALFRVLDDDMLYYREHKILLVQALRWEHQNQNQSILLRGYHLENAATWLRINRNRSNQPPLPLHSQFIEESLNKKGLLSTEVFISYSRTDGDFARLLNNELQIYGKTTWFDQENISAGVNFQQEIYNGIAEADNIVFIISPESVNSKYCIDEVNFAQELNKRFITILVRPTDVNALPKPLRTIQWIDAVNADFQHVFSELIRGIDTDKDHVQQHTKWASRAAEWQQKNQDAALLLRGSELSRAIFWLKEADEKDKTPLPTALQRQFIANSEKAKEETERREKNRKKFVNISIVAVLLVAVAVGSYLFNEKMNYILLKTENDKLDEKAQLLEDERIRLERMGDSLKGVIGEKEQGISDISTTAIAQINSVKQDIGLIETQFTVQRKRADSLQRVIEKRFLPLEGRMKSLHEIKREFDAANAALTRFATFTTRLNTAERTRLQEIVKDYEKAEKQLEDAIK